MATKTWNSFSFIVLWCFAVLQQKNKKSTSKKTWRDESQKILWITQNCFKAPQLEFYTAYLTYKNRYSSPQKIKKGLSFSPAMWENTVPLFSFFDFQSNSRIPHKVSDSRKATVVISISIPSDCPLWPHQTSRRTMGFLPIPLPSNPKVYTSYC